MSRRTRRRHVPEAEPAPVPERAPMPLTAVERDRLHERYAHMRGRSVVLGFESLGIRVEASSPDEMAAMTEAVIVEQTKGQRPS